MYFELKCVIGLIEAKVKTTLTNEVKPKEEGTAGEYVARVALRL